MNVFLRAALRVEFHMVGKADKGPAAVKVSGVPDATVVIEAV